MLTPATHSQTFGRFQKSKDMKAYPRVHAVCTEPGGRPTVLDFDSGASCGCKKLRHLSTFENLVQEEESKEQKKDLCCFPTPERLAK